VCSLGAEFLRAHYPRTYDPLVLAHARALLISTREGICEYIDADLRDPETILEEAARTLDFTQPAAVILVAVAHFLTAADDPAGIVAALAAALAPVISSPHWAVFNV
jgi:S-adenosyl methyltransferase